MLESGSSVVTSIGGREVFVSKNLTLPSIHSGGAFEDFSSFVEKIDHHGWWKKGVEAKTDLKSL